MSEPENHTDPILSARDVNVSYGSGQVLFGVDLDVPQRGTVAVIGRNGAGKTTLLRALLGHQPKTSGTVSFAGKDISAVRPSAAAKSGIGFVPQEHVVFPTLTVGENLRIGLQSAPREHRGSIDFAFELFPKLADRVDQLAGTMSGGERKMVGVARAMLGRPRLLVMDEPTEGVWQGVVDEILARLREFATDASLLIVEQHLDFALALADHVVLLNRGRVELAGPASELRGNQDVRRRLSV